MGCNPGFPSGVAIKPILARFAASRWQAVALAGRRAFLLLGGLGLVRVGGRVADRGQRAHQPRYPHHVRIELDQYLFVSQADPYLVAPGLVAQGFLDRPGALRAVQPTTMWARTRWMPRSRAGSSFRNAVALVFMGMPPRRLMDSTAHHRVDFMSRGQHRSLQQEL